MQQQRNIKKIDKISCEIFFNKFFNQKIYQRNKDSRYADIKTFENRRSGILVEYIIRPF